MLPDTLRAHLKAEVTVAWPGQAAEACKVFDFATFSETTRDSIYELLTDDDIDRVEDGELVPFAVIGFQDVLVPLRSFDQPFDDAARMAIAEMPQEVGACRHGGNNQPSYNDDGPCLLEAAHELLDHPAGERVLIVVSDGLPEGRRSDQADLRRAVEELSHPEMGLELIGLGLGPGTQHVRTYYPESVANVPVARFSDEIARLVERVLLGPSG
jgi:hypothetical protein